MGARRGRDAAEVWASEDSSLPVSKGGSLQPSDARLSDGRGEHSLLGSWQRPVFMGSRSVAQLVKDQRVRVYDLL